MTRLLRLPQVLDKTGLTRSVLYRLEGGGQFPHRVPITGTTVAWLESEIDEWIAERVAARGTMRGKTGEIPLFT